MQNLKYYAGRYSPIMYTSVVLLGIMSLLSPPASAARLATEAIDVLKEAQGADTAFIGRYFGPDQDSVLSFNSNIDPSGNSFNYSLVPGSKYLGLDTTLSTSGNFNSSTNAWDVVSLGSLGSQPWSANASGTFDSDKGDYNWKTPPIPFPPSFGLVSLDYHSSVIYDDRPLSAKFSSADVSFTINNNSVLTVKADDYLRGLGDVSRPKLDWYWKLKDVRFSVLNNIKPSEFQIISLGETPATGNGVFSTRITPLAVPEPSSILSTLVFSAFGTCVILKCKLKQKKLGELDTVV
jgi:hypothetical protein